MPHAPRPTVALVYDFDGTLAPGNCAEYGLLPSLGVDDPKAFWEEAHRLACAHNGDGILAYLRLLAELAVERDPDALAPERLRGHGAAIPFFEGVEGWFARVDAYGADLGLDVRHYVVSSGLEEMIRGSHIAGSLAGVYGCRYATTRSDRMPYWPAQAINYTTKTQYLFRINKGIDSAWDDKEINRYTPEADRPVPFERMIFLGDGDTDIPSMKLVRTQGGHSIAVFEPGEWANPNHQPKVEQLIAEERTSYVAPADYRAGGLLDVTVRGLLSLIARRARR